MLRVALCFQPLLSCPFVILRFSVCFLFLFLFFSFQLLPSSLFISSLFLVFLSLVSASELRCLLSRVDLNEDGVIQQTEWERMFPSILRSAIRSTVLYNTASELEQYLIALFQTKDPTQRYSTDEEGKRRKKMMVVIMIIVLTSPLAFSPTPFFFLLHLPPHSYHPPFFFSQPFPLPVVRNSPRVWSSLMLLSISFSFISHHSPHNLFQSIASSSSCSQLFVTVVACCVIAASNRFVAVGVAAGQRWHGAVHPV